MFRPLSSPVITIGNFDGVHLGHQALLERTRQAADRLDGDAVVMTFEPHPATFLNPQRVPPRLSSVERKQEMLATAGMSVALIESFDSNFAKITAEQFTNEVLAKIVGARHVVVGHDFGYGSDRSGTVATLRDAGRELGFQVEVIEPVEIHGVRASSSQIRAALIEGNVNEANALLGRDYDVDGTVVRGAGRGRELGIPTANLSCKGVLLPAPGIYATWVELLDSGARYMGATSLGTNPTFVDKGSLTLEAHLLDFDGDLYGQRLRVCFAAALRPEKRFDDVESLLAQIHADIDQTRELLSKHEAR